MYCIGCKAEEYTSGAISKEGRVFKYLNFDKQSGMWWCKDCCGYAEIIYDKDTKKPLKISIISE